MGPGDRLSGLMKRYQDGDGSVLAEIYRDIAPGLLNYLFRWCGDRALSEDILQEVFLKVHKVRHTYGPGRPVKPWLYAIARHVAIDAFRKRERRREVAYEETTMDKAESQPNAGLPASHGLDEIEQALDSLPEGQREALILTKVTGLSVREAAQVLGTTEGALKVKVHRAVRAVRRRLDEEESKGEDDDGTR